MGLRKFQNPEILGEELFGILAGMSRKGNSRRRVSALTTWRYEVTFRNFEIP
jgi:hypothetical protein